VSLHPTNSAGAGAGSIEAKPRGAVRPSGAAVGQLSSASHGEARPERIAVLIVTWNRWAMADRVLWALARQTYDPSRLDVVVIDNASTDGTTDQLARRWNADGVVENRTARAHEPRFGGLERVKSGVADETEQRAGTHQFGSLVIVRNSDNLGGCGGFNTGLAYVDQRLSSRAAVRVGSTGGRGGAGSAGSGGSGGGDGVAYVWFVDDDVDLPPDALEHLVRAMRSDPGIGLVGSRTNDINDRALTIETTIYFDRAKGIMCPEPPAEHPRRAQYEEWIERERARAGDATVWRIGRHDYTGVLDVDVASACSLLARWEAVVGTRDRAGVGFWDWRYFIYCDDADWSLRFAKRGWRVVLNLDAVVYHTPWLMKLTPQRLYYAQRNAVWMIQKVLPGVQLRRVTRWWMKTLLKDAWTAAVHRRLMHARIILQTVRDIIDVRPGKTAPEGPAPRPVREVLAELAGGGGKGGGASATTIAVEVPRADVLTQAEALIAANADLGLRWVLLVSNRVPGFEHGPDAARASAAGASEVIVYGPRWRSKARKQAALVRVRPRAVVVFDQASELPVLPTGLNLHIDTKSPGVAQVDLESTLQRVRLAAGLVSTAWRALGFCLRVRPYENAGRYG